MLPDGAHQRPEDWTVFQLNQTEATMVSDPPDPLDSPQEVLGSHDEPTVQPVAKPPRQLLHAMSLVQTKKDATVKRGAVVRALAVVSPMPYIQIFKSYFADKSAANLSRLYDAVNAIDLSRMPALTWAEGMVLRASDRKDLFEDRLSRSSDESTDDGQSSRSRADTTSSKADSIGAVTGPTVSSLRAKSRDSHFFEATVSYNNVPVPVRIPLGTPEDDVGGYSLIRLITTFSSPSALQPLPSQLPPHLFTSGPQTNPIIFLFNAIVSGMRVIFLGANTPAGQISEFVLAASALASGCGSILPGLAERTFPYSMLGNIDNHELNPSGPAYIVGTANPRFEALTSCWDVLFNIETGKIIVSKDARTPSFDTRALSPTPHERDAPMSAVSGTMPFGRSADQISLSASMSSTDGDIGKAPSPLHSNPSSASLPALGNLALSKSEAAKETYDSLFMDDILSAIQQHAGETVIRARFTDYVLRFVRVASHLEEQSFGSTTLGYPSAAFTGTQLGSGAMFVDEQSRSREVAMNTAKVEAWRQTRSCQLFRNRWKEVVETRAIAGFDVLHQLGRLRQARKMHPAEAELIFKTLARSVQSNEQIIELLALTPSHSGGLLPLAFGLLHPSPTVRDAAVDLLTRIEANSTGRKFIQTLNGFYARTLSRLAEERRDSAAGIRPSRSTNAS